MQCLATLKHLFVGNFYVKMIEYVKPALIFMQYNFVTLPYK